ncbi:hypothetical protein [Streptomyces sp. NPDC096030]|uniref:hypothetical protein n=1 Tax=Streptomyces sp. NPDC096030 TaxID=3155423 RepID=UPI00332164D9
MKTFWTVLALTLGALAVGGLVSAEKASDRASIVGHLVIAGALALGSAASWRKRKARDRSA